MIALDVARRAGLETSQDAWHLQRALVDDLATHWQEPDNGLWDIRGPLRHFTHSRVMVWAAFDRATRAAQDHGFEFPLDGLIEIMAAVPCEDLSRGVNTATQPSINTNVTKRIEHTLAFVPLVQHILVPHPRR